MRVNLIAHPIQIACFMLEILRTEVWMEFFEIWIESSPDRVQWNLIFFAYKSYLFHMITNTGKNPNQYLVQFNISVIQLFLGPGIYGK